MNRGTTPLQKIFLQPGEMVIAEEPVMVTTVLGSCISVTMFHPHTQIAAICHAMLPNGGGSKSFKYVDTAVYHMVMFFKHQRIRQKEIQVKLFGGSDMFKNTVSSVSSLTVGRQNISVAVQCLKAEGLVPTAIDVGGNKGRKLIFKTDSGIVFVKKK
ncbi:MAG: chemotaxis protein CheD [Desulfobulbaceae bacterium]|nr:chemotaxis protein CheD [Desulfobulbaceae bacterium]